MLTSDSVKTGKPMRVLNPATRVDELADEFIGRSSARTFARAL